MTPDPATSRTTGARLGLVVPLYNEAGRLPASIDRFADFATRRPGGVDLVFVDDGSVDGTPRVVESLAAGHPDVSIRLLVRTHEGKGAAVAAGIAALDTPVVAFCDVDLATPLGDVERIAALAEAAPVLAIGSRDVAGSVLERPESTVRELLGRSFNRFLQATITPGIVDTQCGAKAARREVWADVLGHTVESGFAWDAEAVAVSLRLGIPVREVPVTWRHDEDSRVRVARDGAAMLGAVRRIRRRMRTIRPATPPVAVDEVFDDARAAEMAAASREHWWFRSKAALVSTALRRTGAWGRGGRLVDVGAGSGAVTAMLGGDPSAAVVVEGSPALVAFARDREHLPAVVAFGDTVPLVDGCAEVVCLLDVIEHLEEPASTLAEARRLLGPGGRLVVNVPAHRWLWSAADEHLGHHRRYTRRMLRRELHDAGYDVALCTHIFSWLVGPVWLRRTFARGEGPELGLDATGSLLDVAASILTFGERQLVGRISLPLGTSVLAVARPHDASTGCDRRTV